VLRDSCCIGSAHKTACTVRRIMLSTVQLQCEPQCCALSFEMLAMQPLPMHTGLRNRVECQAASLHEAATRRRSSCFAMLQRKSCLELQCTSWGTPPCRARLCCPAAGHLSRKQRPICWGSAQAKGGHKCACPDCLQSVDCGAVPGNEAHTTGHLFIVRLSDLAIQDVASVSSAQSICI
jgi:hypothetical protein